MNTLSEKPENQEAPAPAGAGAHDAGPRQVWQWVQSGAAVIIDVRDPDEHARERIQGARLIPLPRLDPDALSRLPRGRIVFHCKSGRRGADAFRLARAALGPDVDLCNLAGGIEAWKREGLPVESNRALPGWSVMRQTQFTIGAATLLGVALGAFVSPWFLVIPAFFGAGLIFAGATGTCGLAALLARMPWNQIAAEPGSCSNGRCG